MAKNQVLYYGWIIMISSLVIGIISFGIRYSFGVFFSSLEQDFRLSRTATSGIFSAYMIFCGVFSIAGGWALDKFEPKKIAMIMGFFTGLSLIVSSQAHSSWQLYISYSLLLAVGTGALFSIVNTTTTRWFARKRGLAIGITSAAGPIGEVFMAPFSTLLVSHYDWRMSFIILGILAWVVLIPVSQLLKRDPSDVGLLPDGIKPETNKITNTTPITLEEGLSLSEAWKVQEFWFLALIWLLLSISVHMVLTHVPPHAIDLGISSLDAALIISLIGVGCIIGRFVDGRLSDSVGRKLPAISSSVLMVAALISLLFIKQLWMFYVFGLLFGYSWGGMGAVVTLLIGDIFGIRSLGLIMGTIAVGWNFGAAIGPSFCGMVYDATRSYSVAFIMAACAMTLATIFSMVIRPQKAKRARG
jgi:MFS family permease